ncbi:PqiC family protein [Histidinibacterium lentulum]|uniref:Membrane integrity-associated transporter subunit PqiC n=1 Tax=Histidinibacterium lentulum TaxID=2480588 RepID=A0A3N2R8E6_9RHOB|nr:ABC-type transport auxiliary lipoprotein family protein [Histidinibacterium lentulum]ROU03734.1 membrane integrity-associated transporter subunit PqiC [Histidinibacterium lentulum]
MPDLLPPLRPALLALVLLTGGCSFLTGPEPRYSAPAVTPTDSVSSRYSSVEVVTVTLPTYAASEDIYVRGQDGALTRLGPLWADDPARAVTQQLAGDLSAITGARVAAEPWPFREFPAARVDVRLTDMVATEDGRFRLVGQYFVAPESGQGDRSGRFLIESPLPAPTTASSIATARGQAVADLALQIARNGLR